MSEANGVPMPLTEEAVLLAEIECFAGQLNRCYNELLPSAKLVALELAQTLRKLRTRLTAKRGHAPFNDMMRRAVAKTRVQP